MSHSALEMNWLRTDYRLSAVTAVVACVFFLTAAPRSAALTAYYRHIFFDNGPRTSQYFYSSGKAVEPSALEVGDRKLPLSSEVFFTPPNSLRISWTSKAGGSWAAQIKVLAIRDREILFEGDTLSFWLYSEDQPALYASVGPDRAPVVAILSGPTSFR